MTAPVDSNATPDWLREWRPYQDGVLFVQTVTGVLRAPYRFCSEWADGRQKAFNPAGFYILSVVLINGLKTLGRNALGAEKVSFWHQISDAQYYLQPLLNAGLAYLLLRLKNPTLRSFRATLAAALLAGGAFIGVTGTTLLALFACQAFRPEWLGNIFSVLAGDAYRDANPLALGVVSCLWAVSFIVVLSLCVGGVNRQPLLRAFVACTTAYVVAFAATFGWYTVLYRLSPMSHGTP